MTGLGSGTGSADYGVYINTSAVVKGIGPGNITISGNGANSATDLQIDTGSNIIGNSAMTGNITLLANTLSYANVDLITKGIIDFSPRTASLAINVNGSSGLVLGNTQLSLIDTTTLPSLVIFGNPTSGTGVVTVTGTYAIGNTTFPLEIAGGCITTAGITESTTKALTLLAETGNITQTAGTLTAGTLNLISTSGNIGSSSGNIVSAVGNITANATSGSVYITNTGAVNLGTSTEGGSFQLLNSSTITLMGTETVPTLTLQTTAGNGSIGLGSHNITSTTSATLIATGSGNITDTTGTISGGTISPHFH